MNDEMLSVVVLTYNHEKFIENTLNSILSQRHNYNYEIIIGDDCSTDNTKLIIQQYVDKHPNIIKPIYNKKNLGLITNYFNVINNVKGKYVMQCAGDDYWLPEKVKRQITFMEENQNVSMIYGNSKGLKDGEFTINKYGSSRDSFYDLILKGNCISAPTVCFRRDILIDYINEIKPLDKQWIIEDYPLWLFFLKKGNCVYINETYSVYRVLDNSLSHFTTFEGWKKIYDCVFSIDNFFIEYFHENNLKKDIIIKYYRNMYTSAIISKNQRMYSLYLYKLYQNCTGYKKFIYYLLRGFTVYICYFYYKMRCLMRKYRIIDAVEE